MPIRKPVKKQQKKKPDPMPKRLGTLEEYRQEIHKTYWADGKKKSAYLEGLKHALHIMTGTHPDLLTWEL